MSTVVIVESPAKAKTINKYLGNKFKVLATVGHVRDLPSKNGSVRPDDDFSMDWEVDSRSKKQINEISQALKGANRLFLATDPDREGEAISWHVCDVLRQKKILNEIEVKRVVFNEITKKAVLEAFKYPRDLDSELIEAYFARRALDYLVGFTLSPVLWRKLPGSKSAGRVQSVALRLICDRELEIENFIKTEYWTVKCNFLNAKKQIIPATLTHFNGGKLQKLSLKNIHEADRAVQTIKRHNFKVETIQEKKMHRHPLPPFTTSTLQQEASRKLRYSATRTMQIAQRLYEGVNINGEAIGLITYMRTDGVQIAKDAINQTRKLIGSDFGSSYLPKSPRIYKTKAKNAQEAHEAIRPTDMALIPKSLIQNLDNDQLNLYRLIWERTIASQMESAILDQVIVDIKCEKKETVLRASGSVVAFDGFFRVYKEGIDDSNDHENPETNDERNKILPALIENESLKIDKVLPEQHFTQPKPRFTEASLVKTLEEHGIGRPSTYASIISVLQTRNYVKLDKRRFVPEDRGRVVTAFLESFFSRYVAYDFTADLENKLDDISGGRIPWKSVLREFWSPFEEAVGHTKELRISEVLDKLDNFLGPHFFRAGKDGVDPRKCANCNDGRLNLKVGKFGAFIGCSNYPDCRFTRPLEVSDGDPSNNTATSGPKLLGEEPDSGKQVSIRKGPYGFYVQLGDEEIIEDIGKKETKKPKVKKIKPKRTSIPKHIDPATLELENAIGLLSLPRDIGIDPNSKDMITASIGRFGPYIKCGATFVSLKGDDDVLTIGLNRATSLMAEAPKKDPPKEIGKHPSDGKPINLKKGRWGFFVQHGRTMATIPKNCDENTLTLELAVNLVNEKSGKKNPNKKKSKQKTKTKKS